MLKEIFIVVVTTKQHNKILETFEQGLTLIYTVYLNKKILKEIFRVVATAKEHN